MKKKQNKNLTNKIIITIFILLIVAFILMLKNSNKTSPVIIDQVIKSQTNEVNTYVSNDLKISFQYPKEWSIDDRYNIILLTNYETDLNRNDSPNDDQIELTINNANLCQKTIDEEIIKGGCGEANIVPTEILNKQQMNLTSGIFYIYTIKNPQGKQQIWYYLQSKDRILQISKEPDPSQFEKEFNEIINSITFL